MVGSLLDDKKEHEWPSEDQKEFFYIDEVNDTELDSSMIESTKVWEYLTDFSEHEINVPQIIDQIQNDYKTPTLL